MSLQTLYKAGAFGPGADIWVVPEGEESNWSYKIDWYLNFQLSRAKFHKPKSLAPDLIENLKENDIEIPAPKNLQNKPLLIASGSRFPNRQVIEVPRCTSTEIWFETVFNIWVELGRPSLRVFLPKGVKETHFQNLWPEKVGSQSITLVPNNE